MQEFTRRSILSTGIFAFGAFMAQAVRGDVTNAVSAPDWTRSLEDALRAFSSKITRIVSSSGEIELHCEMSDLFAFGNSHGNLSCKGVRVKAQGNRLSFQREGHCVAVVLTPRAPSISIPA
jgi:hypothetical protein